MGFHECNYKDIVCVLRCMLCYVRLCYVRFCSVRFCYLRVIVYSYSLCYRTIATQLTSFTYVFIIHVSSLPSSSREMTRKPNCTVVGGTIGQITLGVQVEDEDDALVENELEHDEHDEERERDR